MDAAPMLKLCATMWHETEPEMVKMLASIFRLDMDQNRLRKSKDVGKRTSAYYEFEAHIFFDDAMSEHVKEDRDYELNTFVKSFVGALDKAARVVHKGKTSVPHPTKLDTPYGGRLIWRMPGGNNLIVHLKDRMKIRIKKRWSQVLSMSCHLRCPPGPNDTAPRDPASIYLLHVDGDVDFQPEAVHILLDLITRDYKIGAVSARVLPTGRGPLVWCQQFEYGIGHWLQKSTEDMLGCVLCCPGCFSLFRGSALLQVLDKFTTLATTPAQYILENQGEDRWLTSLLIQSGWHVKYSSTANCSTIAPASFKEFYYQRRRWQPSAFGLTVDLIAHWRRYSKKNSRMTAVYLLYQMFMLIINLLVGSMITWTFSAALSLFTQDLIKLQYSVLINLMPIVLMGIVSIACTTTIQLILAGILTIVYAIAQCFVIGFFLYTTYENGFCSAYAIFLIILIGSFLLAGLLHFTELIYILGGIFFFIFAPSLYLLLIIYTLSNLHVLTWGTREETPPSSTRDRDRSTSMGMPDKTSTGAAGEEAIYDVIDDEEIYDDTKEDACDNDNDGYQSIVDYEMEIQDSWTQSEVLGGGPIKNLSASEREFFQKLVGSQLKPSPMSSAEQEKIASGLIQLRNKVILLYYFINAVFLIGILCLQEYVTGFSVPWTCASSQVLSPFGWISLLLVCLILGIHLVGMVVHRMVSMKRACFQKGCCGCGVRSQRTKGRDVELGGAAGEKNLGMVVMDGV